MFRSMTLLAGLLILAGCSKPAASIPATPTPTPVVPPPNPGDQPKPGGNGPGKPGPRPSPKPDRVIDPAEDKVVKSVEKLGGSVTLDEKQAGNPVVGVDL